MWENPIEIIQTDIQYKVVDEYEKQILKAIQSYGISVNKKELVKALNYDRNQYKKGYADAKAEQCWIPCSKRLPEKANIYLVSTEGISVNVAFYSGNGKWTTQTGLTEVGIDAWQPLPEPYKEEKE